MSAASAAALRRLEALFEGVTLNDSEARPRKSFDGVQCESTVIEDERCDVHGKENRRLENRRGSLGNVLQANRRNSAPFGRGVGSRRDSMPALHVIHNHPPMVRRDSSGLGLPPARSPDPTMHPSSFPSMLRRDSLNTSTVSVRRESANLRRDSLTSSTGSLRRDLAGSKASRRDSISSAGSSRKGSIGSNGSWRKDSLGGRRRFSTDSLDMRRNSWDIGRRGSSSSSGGWEDPGWSEVANGKVRLADEHLLR